MRHVVKAEFICNVYSKEDTTVMKERIQNAFINPIEFIKIFVEHIPCDHQTLKRTSVTISGFTQYTCQECKKDLSVKENSP